jgi:RNA polymerase sigma-70 factor (ECF subfamily)
VDPDNALIERSVRGRPDAFVEVVRRHELAIHAFLARRGGHQVADDLLGEVWLRAFAARGGYDGRHDDARPWLYGIARNVLRGHWRAMREAGPGSGSGPRSGSGSGSGSGLGLGSGSGTAGEIADPWDEVVDRLDSAAQVRAIAAAVRGLPREEREVLLLVAWEQLTPAQAAVALGVPPGTARSRLHRARAALRAQLAAIGEDS